MAFAWQLSFHKGGCFNQDSLLERKGSLFTNVGLNPPVCDSVSLAKALIWPNLPLNVFNLTGMLQQPLKQLPRSPEFFGKSLKSTQK